MRKKISKPRLYLLKNRLPTKANPSNGRKYIGIPYTKYNSSALANTCLKSLCIVVYTSLVFFLPIRQKCVNKKVPQSSFAYFNYLGRAGGRTFLSVHIFVDFATDKFVQQKSASPYFAFL